MSNINQKKNRLSDEQVERLLVTIETLKDKNVIAEMIAKALEKQDTFDDKRKVLVSSFAQTYELMVCMNTGINATLAAAEFKANLVESRKAANAQAN